MNETTYTLYHERDDGTDLVLARHLPILQAMREIVEGDGRHRWSLRQEDYESYRRFEWFVRSKVSLLPAGLPVLSATVDRTGDPGVDKSRAQTLVYEQFIRHAHAFWNGTLQTDAAYDRRLRDAASKEFAVRRDREVCTGIVDAVIGAGFSLTGPIYRDKFEIDRSTDREAVLRCLFASRDAMFYAIASERVYWLHLRPGDRGDRPLAEYSSGLADLIAPLMGSSMSSTRRPSNVRRPCDRTDSQHIAGM